MQAGKSLGLKTRSHKPGGHCPRARPPQVAELLQHQPSHRIQKGLLRDPAGPLCQQLEKLRPQRARSWPNHLSSSKCRACSAEGWGRELDLDCLGSNPSSSTYYLCGPGQLALQLWASVSSPGKWNHNTRTSSLGWYKDEMNEQYRNILTSSILTVCMLSHSVVSDSLWTSRTVAPPGSSVHGILQVRIPEWVAIPFSKGSFWPRDWTWVSCIAGGFFTVWATREAQYIY